VDFDRANTRHIAFGLGPHRCIGSDVVRLEFRIMFEQVLNRMPDFRVEEAGLRPSPRPAIVAGYEHVPFVFMPGKKVGGPCVAGAGPIAWR
jgi:cytochrome P450